MTRFLFLAALVGCGCTNKSTTPTGTGSATPPAPDVTITSCDTARPKVEALYRAAVPKKEAGRAAAFVADNTTMVLNDCAKLPDKVVPCLAAARTVDEVEARCVAPLDDEGTEGDALRK